MGFSEETIQKVWERGKDVSNAPNEWRQDECLAWIARSQYGNRNSIYGWEIDHITPESEGGTDALSNLRPLQWENNTSKQAGRLVCVITSSGKENIRKQ